MKTATPPPPPALAALLATTPARLAIGRTGPRPTAATYLRFLADHARARDAVFTEVPAAVVKKLGLVEIATAAPSRAAYLREPRLGRALAPSTRTRLARCRKRPEVQLLLVDGLSSMSLVRIGFDGKGGAGEAQRIDMKRRIREVAGARRRDLAARRRHAQGRRLAREAHAEAPAGRSVPCFRSR